MRKSFILAVAMSASIFHSTPADARVFTMDQLNQIIKICKKSYDASAYKDLSKMLDESDFSFEDREHIKDICIAYARGRNHLDTI